MLFALLWAASFVGVGVVILTDEWPIGIGHGSAFVEHNTVGDNTAPYIGYRFELERPQWWVRHESGKGWETWSVPMWPLAAVGIVTWLALKLVQQRHVRT